MTRHPLPQGTAAAHVAIADLDELFTAEPVPAHGHAQTHATCGLSANDETTYTAEAVPAYGHAQAHITYGLSANDETVYVPAS
ncbi:hypothetical protein GCM10023195_23460 [Actinoallomurus liliacearum]|uniref:Uncharacterized protein n=1 Tax=Actinoallomurus liliacearum TaxID=1080073 RepID=A0ABP8TH75_9ACTN